MRRTPPQFYCTRPSASGDNFPFLYFCGLGTAVCRADAHIGLAEQTAFTKICGEFAVSQRADRVVGPYAAVFQSAVSRRGGRLCPPYPVGADDSVRPQKYTNFTEIFGEFTQSKAPLGLKGPIGVGMLARSA